ncbi:NitT/TauT family transport system ATP-binding protein [Acinetobacter calcoaceticus]|uniref:NitT/TauT family transport system ATP-binding protein n=1 Tax=Acinetobacter calcoaceticus TaxID=471 RepID=A0A4R1XWH0_ACICA|nr:NitT/TauT family transport system ATP-binding protein [Acinetobacter calcoaceticus]
MQQLEKSQIQIGYIPLLDCIAILWAQHRGYFKAQGLEVTLMQEPSWASLRDRLAFGVLDAAHCLSAMLPAAAIGSDQLGIPLQTSLNLSVNQAFISLSQQLCDQLNISASDSATESAEKVCAAIKSGQSIKLAHVFKHSLHHYCLRHWLALADQEIAADIALMTSPPPYMVEGIAKQVFDGFCVSEPWNIQAQIQGHSLIIASGAEICPDVADKVLAVTQDWALKHPRTLHAMTQAIHIAQLELQQLPDLSEVLALLSQYHILRFTCSDRVHVQTFHHLQHTIRQFIVARSTPQQADFVWLIEQMQLSDQLELSPIQIERIAKDCIVTRR